MNYEIKFVYKRFDVVAQFSSTHPKDLEWLLITDRLQQYEAPLEGFTEAEQYEIQRQIEMNLADAAAEAADYYCDLAMDR